MSTRTDSYVGSNGQILTSGSYAGQAAIVNSGRAHVVAASTQFDLTGSNAGNFSFIQDAQDADTKFHFADGSIVSGNDLPIDVVFEAPLQKVITPAGVKVVVFWK